MIRLARQPRPDMKELVCPELIMIPIDAIRPNPYQPRRTFSDESLTELASSIREIGLIQPVNVRRTGDDRYELVAGERRLRACKLAGLSHIKAIVMSAAVDRDVAAIALIENLQRENLNFFEEAEGYQSLIRVHGFTQEELARRLSKNQSTIANKLRLLRLSRAVRERIESSQLTERHARALLRLHNEESQLRLLEKIIEEKLSVKETEELVEEELEKLYGEAPPEEGGRDRKVIHMRCSYMIYVNTIKQAFKKITDSGVKASFDTADTPEYTEVTIRLMHS